MIDRRRLFALCAALAMAPLPGQAQSPPRPAIQPAPVAPLSAPPVVTARVRLATSEGPIVIDLFGRNAPVTVANFLRYVDKGLYTGAAFYRASRIEGAPGQGLIQGGLRDSPDRLAPIRHESTLRTGLRHTDGTISMGRFEPGTATSEFFILSGDAPELDADPAQKGDNQGFAAFGRVSEGMDTVRKILAKPLAPTGGPAAMRGEILKRPVPILYATRLGAEAEPPALATSTAGSAPPRQE